MQTKYKRGEGVTKKDIETLAFETADLLPIIKEAVKSGKGFVLTVTGQSMRPTLRNLKDKVELVALKKELRKGDLLFFERDDGSCILHRVIKVQSDSYIVSGDAQTWTEVVKKDKAIAIVKRVCKNGRWIDCDSFSYRFADCFRRIAKPLRIFARSIRRKIK